MTRAPKDPLPVTIASSHFEAGRLVTYPCAGRSISRCSMSPTMFWGSDVGILVVHFMQADITIKMIARIWNLSFMEKGLECYLISVYSNNRHNFNGTQCTVIRFNSLSKILYSFPFTLKT